MKNVCKSEGFSTTAVLFQYNTVEIAVQVSYDDVNNEYLVQIQLAGDRCRNYVTTKEKALYNLPTKLIKKYHPKTYTCLADY